MKQTMSRRKMIGASVAAASLARKSAANSAITVGTLGAGSRGTYLSTMIAKNTRRKIVALCDVFDEKMEKAKKSIGVESPRLYKD
jgi:predicted homoserine dehydrogenase-like protein